MNLLTQQRGKEAVGVCAATGVAGVHISGSTVHSFLGCGKAETEQDAGVDFRIFGVIFGVNFREITMGANLSTLVYS